MTRRKRVAHFVRKFLPPFTSFVKNQIMNHYRYYAVVVYKEYMDTAFAREITEKIPSFHCDNSKKGLVGIYSDLLYRKPFRRLAYIDKKHIREYLEVNEIDVIHYHYGTDAGVFIGSAPTNIASLVSFYGYDCSSFPRWYLGLGKYYLRKVFDRVDCCLAMSEDMKSDLLNIGCPPHKIKVHYYGTDVQQFYQERDYRDNYEIVFLSVGYLVPQKGHAFSLRAFH
jgi:colanic acid/amylovoran biosynthesis glycosyltransferase